MVLFQKYVWSSMVDFCADRYLNFSKKTGQRRFGLLSKIMPDRLSNLFLYAWKMLSTLSGGLALIKEVFRNQRVLWVWI